jgi:pimeloyl-ACP methyl ester carboxylesterase
MAQAASEFAVDSAGVTLAGEQTGEGPPVVLLHGLTATRRYVVLGSNALARAGHRVISYDARGHGRSAPALCREEYTYEALAGDLESVLRAHAPDGAVLAGGSMGAHTALRFALAHPAQVAALALITPAYDPASYDLPESLASWDALARGLRGGGVEGFMRAYDFEAVDERWRKTVRTAIGQRMALHEHPLAVADALEATPCSRPFEDFSELSALTCPAVVIGSRDGPDPGHPLAIARRYADALPAADLIVEDDGSPVAWQGGRVSQAIAQVAAEASAGHT